LFFCDDFLKYWQSFGVKFFSCVKWAVVLKREL